MGQIRFTHCLLGCKLCAKGYCDVYCPNSLILGIAEKLGYHDQIAGVGSQTK